MGSGTGVMAKSEPEFCVYVSIKVDREILPNVKAAAALDRMDMQDWVSDVLNREAAERTGQKPVKRKPAPPSKRRK